MPDIDLRDVDLNLLVALDAMLARGTVSAAAKELGLTQPAMSRTLQRLRDLLGDPLFVRAGRGLVATDRARSLEQPVQEALRAIRRALEPPQRFDPATARGEFTFAAADEAQLAFADAVIGAIRVAAPRIDVRVRPLSLASLDEGRRGVIDAALTPELSALPPTGGGDVDLSGLVQRRLYTRRFVVVRSSRHPEPLDLDAYCAADHVIVGWDGGRRGFVDDLLAPLGRARRVAATVTSFLSAARLVAATDLVCTLPSEVVHLTGEDLVAHPPPLALPSLPMVLAWEPRNTSDPRHRILRELAADAIVARARSWARA